MMYVCLNNTHGPLVYDIISKIEVLSALNSRDLIPPTPLLLHYIYFYMYVRFVHLVADDLSPSSHLIDALDPTCHNKGN
jgi:hypothetical protein